LLRAYGAEVTLTPGSEGMAGAIRKAEEMAESDPRYFIPQQFENPANPEIHRRTTAEEIWRDTQGRVTHFVAGIGTGGTIMGTARGLRSRGPVQVVAVEPAEALHGLEGLKHMPSSIVPPIYREEELDRKLSISTDAGWDMAERLIAEEGLLAGHSAGAAAVGALQVARELSEAALRGVVVMLFPDRADRYLPPAVRA